MQIKEKYKNCNTVEELKDKVCENFGLRQIEEEHPVKKELEAEIDAFIKEIFGE